MAERFAAVARSGRDGAVNTVLPLTSANSNGVSLLGVSSGDFTVQTLIDKLNELINALRR